MADDGGKTLIVDSKIVSEGQANPVAQIAETDTQIIVRRAKEAAEQLNLIKPPSPWPPLLPNELSLATLLSKLETEYWSKDNGWPSTSPRDQGWMRVPIGLLDDPKNQQQPALFVDLSEKDNNISLLGSVQQGKTTFLLNLATALALRHTPDQIHFHLVDYSAGQLAAILDMPHVQGLYRTDEIEKLQRLLYLLQQELSERQALCNNENLPDLRSFLTNHPDINLPVQLVLIDNFVKFREITQLDSLSWLGLMREGGKFGICFVFTSDKLPGDDYLNLAGRAGSFT